MTKIVRQTISMTEANQIRLKELGTHYNLNLYQMIDSLISSAKNDDDAIIAAGNKIKEIALAERKRVKSVKDQLSSITPEQLATLLKGL